MGLPRVVDVVVAHGGDGAVGVHERVGLVVEVELVREDWGWSQYMSNSLDSPYGE